MAEQFRKILLETRSMYLDVDSESCLWQQAHVTPRTLIFPTPAREDLPSLPSAIQRQQTNSTVSHVIR